MTFIFNFCSLAAAVICLITGFRLHRSYRQTRMEAIKSYSNSFFFISLAYFVLSLPGIILFDAFWVQLAFVLTDTFLLTTILFTEPATLSLSEKLRPYKITVFFFILFWTLIHLLLNVIFFSKAIPLIKDDIVYYWKAGIPWLQNITRMLLVLSVLSMTFLFFRWARVSEEKNIIYRSLIIGLNTLLIAISGSIFWFMPFFYFSPELLIFSGIIGLLGYTGAVVSTIVFRFPQEV